VNVIVTHDAPFVWLPRQYRRGGAQIVLSAPEHRRASECFLRGGPTRNTRTDRRAGARSWVIDHKPPRAFGDDRTTLVALLQYQRDCVVRKVAGLTDEQARWSPVASGTSLLWLLRHLGRAEVIWVLHRFAGQDVDPDLLSDELAPGDTLGGLVGSYRRIWALVDEVVATNDLDTICFGEDEEANPDLRWVLAHLVEEAARHAGHADILRELLDGAIGR
jgi:hypothetical protein